MLSVQSHHLLLWRCLAGSLLTRSLRRSLSLPCNGKDIFVPPAGLPSVDNGVSPVKMKMARRLSMGASKLHLVRAVLLFENPPSPPVVALAVT